MIVKVKGFYDRTKEQFVFKNRPLAVASLVEFNFGKVKIFGWVVDDDYNLQNKELDWFRVEAKWLEVYPWQLEALEKGMVMDGFGDKKIAKLIDFKGENADMITTDNLGRVYVRKNPLERDVYLTFKLLAEKHGNEYYFAGHQKLKVGEKLWVYFKKIDLEEIKVTKISSWQEQ